MLGRLNDVFIAEARHPNMRQQRRLRFCTSSILRPILQGHGPTTVLLGVVLAIRTSTRQRRPAIRIIIASQVMIILHHLLRPPLVQGLAIIAKPSAYLSFQLSILLYLILVLQRGIALLHVLLAVATRGEQLGSVLLLACAGSGALVLVDVQVPGGWGHAEHVLLDAAEDLVLTATVEHFLAMLGIEALAFGHRVFVRPVGRAGSVSLCARRRLVCVVVGRARRVRLIFNSVWRFQLL